MKHVGRDIFHASSMEEFMTYMPEEPWQLEWEPGVQIRELLPVDIFRAYTLRCGGDPEMTIDTFVEQGAEDPRLPDPRFLSE